MLQKRVASPEDISYRYKFWRKYVSTLYDFVGTQTVNAPIACVELLDTTKGDWSSLLANAGNSGGEWNARHSRLVAVGNSAELGYSTQSSMELVRMDIPSPSDDEAVSSIENLRTKQLASVPMTMGTEELLVFRAMPQRSTFVASTSAEGLVLWDFEGRGENVKNYEVSKAFGPCLAWSPSCEGLLLLGTSSGGVMRFDASREKVVDSRVGFTEMGSQHKDQIMGVDWHGSNPQSFLSCATDGTVVVWDMRTADSVALLIRHAHGEELGVNCIASQPTSEPELFLTGAGVDFKRNRLGPRKPEVKLWDCRKMDQSIHTFTSNPGVALGEEDQGCSVNQVRWNPLNSQEFGACSDDGAVRLWDMSRIGAVLDEESARDGPPELLFVHGGHVSAVTDFQWDPVFKRTLISASDENVMIWRPLPSAF